MSTHNPKDDTRTPIIIDPVFLKDYYDHDDEINLVDLWLALVAQKKVFFITVSLFIILAALYILIVPVTYSYKTDISIGTQSQSQLIQSQSQLIQSQSQLIQSQSQLIQSPEAIVANLDNAIIPKILRQQYLDQPDSKLNISASIPKKTNSVLLSSTGTIEQKDDIVELHQQLINILTESHHNKVVHMLNYLNEELTSSQAMLSKLIDQSKSNAGNNEQITMQTINLENNIRKAKRSIVQFTDTHSAMGTVQSIKPTNKNSKLILAVSIVLGLFMGIFSALFASFLAKAKEQTKKLSKKDSNCN